jgi:uncharacterized membrane protein YvbJ
MICPKCNVKYNADNMFCKNCGTALIPEKQIKSPIRQTKILGIDNRLVALVLGALLVVSIILGVITISTHNRLSITCFHLQSMARKGFNPMSVIGYDVG